MARVRYGVARHRRRKRLLDKAKGFWGARSRHFTSAKETLVRAEAYATRDRRNRKRDFRRLWITRISGGLHGSGLNYSRFIAGLKANNIELNRKMLSEIAIRNPDAFDRLVSMVKG